MKIREILYSAIIAVMAATSIGCSDDTDKYDSGTIAVYRNGFIFDENDFGVETFTTYETDNIASIEVQEYPLGWSTAIEFDEKDDSGTLYITTPAQEYSGMEYEGDIKLRGKTPDGTYAFATIYVAMAEFINLEEKGVQANSFIVNEPGKVYLFNPNRRGESEAIAPTKAESCQLTWRTAGSPISYVMMYDDMIGFYTSLDTSDLDEDDEEDDLVPGNAVISALASDDTVLWSWHIWVTENTIETVTLNGVEFMNYNLGALNQSTYDEDEIVESYGLYYQWGRKDPFIYPVYYNASGSLDAFLYVSGDYTYQSYPRANASNASLSYTSLYPKSFICGTANSNYDWLYAGRHNDDLWGTDGDKTIYDPSPKGWRVPSSSDLSALSSLSAVAVEQTDNGSITDGYAASFDGELFMALGQRIYRDGSIQNLAPNTYAPWAGYYWSRDVAEDASNGGKRASSLLFYLDTSDNNAIVVDTTYPDYRSTGMQIRCVKM